MELLVRVDAHHLVCLVLCAQPLQETEEHTLSPRTLSPQHRRARSSRVPPPHTTTRNNNNNKITPQALLPNLCPSCDAPTSAQTRQSLWATHRTVVCARLMGVPRVGSVPRIDQREAGIATACTTTRCATIHTPGESRRRMRLFTIQLYYTVYSSCHMEDLQGRSANIFYCISF